MTNSAGDEVFRAGGCDPRPVHRQQGCFGARDAQVEQRLRQPVAGQPLGDGVERGGAVDGGQPFTQGLVAPAVEGGQSVVGQGPAGARRDERAEMRLIGKIRREHVADE